MQSKANNPIDTRSFPEIYSSLTRVQQNELLLRGYNARLFSARQTIWKWAQGVTPRSPVVRSEAAKVVGKYIGAKCPVETLFPCK